MNRLIYTKGGMQVAGLGGAMRNADLFDKVESQVTEVVVEGDYPDIKSAYEKMGVNVLSVETAKSNDAGLSGQAEFLLKLEQMKKALTETKVPFLETDTYQHIKGLYDQFITMPLQLKPAPDDTTVKLEPAEQAKDEKAGVMNELDTLQVKYAKNASLETLKNLLAETKAKLSTV